MLSPSNERNIPFSSVATRAIQPQQFIHCRAARQNLDLYETITAAKQ